MKRVLVDTSVWVEHFRQRSPALTHLLALDLVMTHPLILGELACGTPPNRAQTLADLSELHRPPQATVSEVINFIEQERLFGLGCGLIDLMLLSSTLMAPGLELWTRDKRLHALAARFGIAHQVAPH